MQEKNDERRLKNQEQRALLLKIGIMLFITFACCALFFFMLLRYEGFASGWNKVFSTLQPIIIGAILAYLMNPVMKRIETFLIDKLGGKVKDPKKFKKTARGIAVTCSVIILLLILALLIATIVPAISKSATELINKAPGYVDKTVELIEKSKLNDNKYVAQINDYAQQAYLKAEEWFQEKVLPEAQTYITQVTAGIYNVAKSLINFIIGIIVMVYVLNIKESLIGQAKKIIYTIFKPKRGNVIIHVFRKADKIFGGFITGKIVDSAIIGVICYVGCLILRIPDSILVAVIIGVTNIIPVFGPFIGAIPSLILVVIQDPMRALYLLIFIIILQQVDGNIIGPKILGSSTGLSTFWVMFAILLGGGLFGFPGMLLGVPSFGVIYYIISKICAYILEKRKLPITTDKYVTLHKIDLETNQPVYDIPFEDAEKEMDKAEKNVEKNTEKKDEN